MDVAFRFLGWDSGHRLSAFGHRPEIGEPLRERGRSRRDDLVERHLVFLFDAFRADLQLVPRVASGNLIGVQAVGEFTAGGSQARFLFGER